MINNIELIKPLLKFTPDTYYFGQVLRRKKDHPEERLGDQKLYSSCICSEGSYTKFCEISKVLCESFGARAYISIIPRSLERLCGLEAVSLVQRMQLREDFKSIIRLGDSLSMQHETVKWRGVIPSSRFLLDVDNIVSYNILMEEIDKTPSINIEVIIPTPHGKHIITNAFYPQGVWPEIVNTGDDYVIPGDRNITFTARPECATVLYSL